MSDAKRTTLRERIEAGQARQTERERREGDQRRARQADFGRARSIRSLVAGRASRSASRSPALFPRSPTRKLEQDAKRARRVA